MSSYDRREQTTVKSDKRNFQKNFGFLKAFVVSNNDFECKIGRVQVRIPSLHGWPEETDKWLEDEKLPWATPAFIGGCGEDFGSFLVPVPGTWVLVVLEDNDDEKIFYFASIPSTGPKKSKLMTKYYDDGSPLEPWYTIPGEPEIPRDVFVNKPTGTPERSILYKSYKGHTILFDDTDGEESLQIIDRLGQIIKFNGHVSKSGNEGGYRRGLANALEDTQLSKGEEPSIVIKTGPTQELQTYSQAEYFMDKINIDSVNLETGQETITRITPSSFLQKTKDSEIESLEDSIRIEFPNVKSFYDELGYYTEAYDNARVSLTSEEAKIEFKDAIASFRKEGVDVLYKKAHIKLDGSSMELSYGEKTNAVIGDNRIVLTAGEASISLEDNIVKINGVEVHLNEVQGMRDKPEQETEGI